MSRPLTAAERADVAALSGMAAVAVPNRMSATYEEAHAKLCLALHGTILHSQINPPAKQQGAVETLATICGNALREPDNEKFRRVRCTNEAIRSKLLSVKGAEEFLKAAGWRDKNIDFQRHLVLEVGFDVELLTIADRLLTKCIETVKEKAERAAREEWLRKNEATLRREATLVAIAEDKERRREAAERLQEERRALTFKAAEDAQKAAAAAQAKAAAEQAAGEAAVRAARET